MKSAVSILIREGEEIACFDMEERGPTEVFKARVTYDEHVFYQETDPEETNRVLFRYRNGNMLEVECRGWFGDSFFFKHEEKVHSLNRSPFNRSFILTDEDGLEKGRGYGLKASFQTTTEFYRGHYQSR